MNTELISLILNLLFGGGFLVTLVTLRSERKKAIAKAEDAELDTIEKATKILMDSIVTPLKKELSDVRKEITRLRKAINKSNTCSFSSDCPVRKQLQDASDDGAE